MKVEKNKVIGVAYELRTDLNDDIVDSATADAPFEFLAGYDNVLEKFEAELNGLDVGSKFKFTLAPEDGYGVYDDTAVVQLDVEEFRFDGELQDDLMKVGGIIPLQDNHGNQHQGWVTAVSETHVTVDLNHPLAGKSLMFSGEVVSIREAHPIELEHGHVHSNGQHLHD